MSASRLIIFEVSLFFFGGEQIFEKQEQRGNVRLLGDLIIIDLHVRERSLAFFESGQVIIGKRQILVVLRKKPVLVHLRQIKFCGLLFPIGVYIFEFEFFGERLK